MAFELLTLQQFLQQAARNQGVLRVEDAVLNSVSAIGASTIANATHGRLDSPARALIDMIRVAALNSSPDTNTLTGTTNGSTALTLTHTLSPSTQFPLSVFGVIVDLLGTANTSIASATLSLAGTCWNGNAYSQSVTLTSITLEPGSDRQRVRALLLPSIDHNGQSLYKPLRFNGALTAFPASPITVGVSNILPAGVQVVSELIMHGSAHVQALEAAAGVRL